ncbi:MAG: A/G-specific adenine glycosylase [Acidobacteriota bacterium]
MGRSLIDWYRRHARQLPWRATSDPYAILVAEIMLQQTRVDTVRDRYAAFLDRFPDLGSLAAAESEEVLTAWSGLGYYRRAQALHALARRVMQEHDGRLPADLEGLRSLPGIGPYTAAAVASIAFGVPALALDGNVGRVLCRLAAVREDPRRPVVRRQLQRLTAGWFRHCSAGDLNQALMELGARICRPRSPRCRECPCQQLCQARKTGIEEQIPPSRKQPVRPVNEAAAVIEEDGRYLLIRGQRPGLLQEMWEFPTLDSRLKPQKKLDGGPALQGRSSLRLYLLEMGWQVELGETLGEIRHAITDRSIRCRVYRGRWQQKATSPLPPDDGGDHPARPTADAADSTATGQKPTPESGWFTPLGATRLPLAASAVKILSQLLHADLTPSGTAR